MDFGAVSHTTVKFRLWRRLVRLGSQSKNKICFISPARGASYFFSQVKSSLSYASDRHCLQWLPNGGAGINLLCFGKLK